LYDHTTIIINLISTEWTPIINVGHQAVEKKQQWSVPPANKWILILLIFAIKIALRRIGLFINWFIYLDKSRPKRKIKDLNSQDH